MNNQEFYIVTTDEIGSGYRCYMSDGSVYSCDLSGENWTKNKMSNVELLEKLNKFKK